jgi:signal transduction histidine kinase
VLLVTLLASLVLGASPPDTAVLLGAGVLALALALGGAALLTRRVLAPITRLTQAARRIASTGHYQERVPASGQGDEIGQLAATINALIATVERTLNQQREFLADTSHELRSPLTVVLANLALLRRDLDQAERELSVQEAMAEAQRMRRLVNELLLLAQADAAQVIAHAPVDLGALVTAAVEAAQRQSPDHTFMAHVATPIVVSGDQERLTQLVRNLLENAINHTPPGTRVEVALRRADGQAQLVVADDGPGIAAAYLPRIWDRFLRVDKGRSRALGGTGLGLAIVKYIAEAHGGRAEVWSSEGAGARFMITLPLGTGVVPADQSIEASRA